MLQQFLQLVELIFPIITVPLHTVNIYSFDFIGKLDTFHTQWFSISDTTLGSKYFWRALSSDAQNSIRTQTWRNRKSNKRHKFSNIEFPQKKKQTLNSRIECSIKIESNIRRKALWRLQINMTQIELLEKIGKYYSENMTDKVSCRSIESPNEIFG